MNLPFVKGFLNEKRNKKYPSLFATVKTGLGTIASIALHALARYAPDSYEFRDGPSQPGK